MPVRCGRGIHNGGFRLHPWSGHCAAHGARGKTDTRMAAYPFDLPNVRQGVDIQDAMLFSKPYRGLDGRPRKVKKLECANAEKVTRPHPAKESDYQRTSTR